MDLGRANRRNWIQIQSRRYRAFLSTNQQKRDYLLGFTRPDRVFEIAPQKQFRVPTVGQELVKLLRHRRAPDTTGVVPAKTNPWNVPVKRIIP